MNEWMNEMNEWNIACSVNERYNIKPFRIKLLPRASDKTKSNLTEHNYNRFIIRIEQFQSALLFGLFACFSRSVSMNISLQLPACVCARLFCMDDIFGWRFWCLPFSQQNRCKFNYIMMWVSARVFLSVCVLEKNWQQTINRNILVAEKVWIANFNNKHKQKQ